MAIEITDEMRRAVLLEICDQQGHALDMSGAFSQDNRGQFGVHGRNPNQEPHIRCTRCDRTWLVVDDPGTNYDDAMTKFRDRLKTGDPKKKPPTK